MAHTKAGGASRINKDSESKRLGLKKFGGEKVISGNIIIRQRGTKVHPGAGTMMGTDFTIFAVITGSVTYYTKFGRTYVKVV
ncbi:MAG: 50S ribosomal protein L27 [Patescibacteria group bacterium]|jgi:large subunit ribosomal protein L27